MKPRFTHTGGHHLEVAGARLWVEEIGRPDGPPVLLLPGGLGTINDFDALTPHLAPHARLIGLDSRGHGGSTLGRARLSYARLAADVQAVAAQLGLEGVTLLGFSDGAITGLRLAAAGWPRLARLATIGATWRLLPDDPVAALIGGITPESFRETSRDAWSVYHAANPEPDLAGLIAQIRRLWLDPGTDGYPGESVRSIACPVLLMRGNADPYATRAETVALAERIPGARLLDFPWSGHGLHVDAPVVVADLLRRFLADG
ncbi:MAG: alpha/beta hydrolase [Amaricoccus sp.]|uniref:alpha/beta fold hydrolase n=1 Tax=Amaricoccus sp. TaxID=1872485 RepID=UPI0039E277D8